MVRETTRIRTEGGGGVCVRNVVGVMADGVRTRLFQSSRTGGALKVDRRCSPIVVYYIWRRRGCESEWGGVCRGVGTSAAFAFRDGECGTSAASHPSALVSLG